MIAAVGGASELRALTQGEIAVDRGTTERNEKAAHRAALLWRAAR
jgi:hypothetical protein